MATVAARSNHIGSCWVTATLTTSGILSLYDVDPGECDVSFNDSSRRTGGFYTLEISMVDGRSPPRVCGCVPLWWDVHNVHRCCSTEQSGTLNKRGTGHHLRSDYHQQSLTTPIFVYPRPRRADLGTDTKQRGWYLCPWLLHHCTDLTSLIRMPTFSVGFHRGIESSCIIHHPIVRPRTLLHILQC